MKQQKQEEINVCEECGASVYREHLDSGIARYESGKLLCSHCVSEYERSHDVSSGGAAAEFAPIELDEDEDDSAGTDMSSTRVHSLTGSTLGAGLQTQFKRALQPKSPYASRCRTFHCRLSDGAVDFMTNQVNEWLDENEDVSIKFATSTIGLFEGKHTEPNLILTVFY